MKIILSVLAACAVALHLVAEVPEVTITECKQDSSTRNVTIDYTLAKGPAIVTLEIYTNCQDGAVGAPIDGRFVRTLSGEVNKVVTNGSYTIIWNARQDWPDQKISTESVKAKVTAWMLDMPPDVMVVDLALAVGASQCECRYYTSLDALPGGLLENPEYRETKLVMKKVKAPQDGRAQIGAVGEYKLNASNSESLRRVALANDYYLGVFEFTQRQYKQVMGSYPSSFFTAERDMRPVGNMSYNAVRGGNGYEYPAAPNTGNILGTLRSRLPYAVDLPSETQWEYAGRAGIGDGRNNDGSPILATSDALSEVEDVNLSRLARYSQNNGLSKVPNPLATTLPADGGTNRVGSYDPNPWGFYDMHGNLQEYVLDFWKADLSQLDGAVVTSANADDSSKVVVRGGAYWDNPAGLRMSRRTSVARTGANYKSCGFRICSPVTRK